MTSLRGHGDEVLDLVFSPSGKHLVSCSSDRTIRTWGIAGMDGPNAPCTRTNIDYDHASTLAFTADSRYVW